MAKKMKEEGTMDKKCFSDKAVLIDKVEPRSNSESQQRIIVWCLDFSECSSIVGKALYIKSYKTVIAVIHKCHGVGMAKV